MCVVRVSVQFCGQVVCGVFVIQRTKSARLVFMIMTRLASAPPPACALTFWRRAALALPAIARLLPPPSPPPLWSLRRRSRLLTLFRVLCVGFVGRMVMAASVSPKVQSSEVREGGWRADAAVAPPKPTRLVPTSLPPPRCLRIFIDWTVRACETPKRGPAACTSPAPPRLPYGPAPPRLGRPSRIRGGGFGLAIVVIHEGMCRRAATSLNVRPQ